MLTEVTNTITNQEWGDALYVALVTWSLCLPCMMKLKRDFDTFMECGVSDVSFLCDSCMKVIERFATQQVC
jgi:hypothetical protein